MNTAKSDLDPNAHQRRAANPARSVWVSASAGTGKTKVLTDRVLSLLLQGTPPHKILCLTFTRAAAAEMANRINKALGAWAIADDASLEESIRELTDQPATEEQIRRARQLFRHVLETPGGMKIQTLHSFCESLLGRFPLEAGLAPHFSAMDEREARDAQREATANILSADSSTDDEKELAAAVDALAGWQNEDQFNELMTQLASDRGRLKRLIGEYQGVKNVIAAVHDRMGVRTDETTESIITAACAEDAFDGAALRKVAAIMVGAPGVNDRKYGAFIADWLAATGDEKAKLFETYLSAYLTAKGEIRKSLAGKPTEDALPGARDILGEEADRLHGVRLKLNALITAKATAALITVGDALIDEFERWKLDHGLLDYDDLILRARSLLEKQGGASWVLFKLDGGIDHILIDEAQDTNPDQWAVVAALANEFFAGDGARDLDRTIFAVGDVKQSIYSFQRADPEAFGRMRDHFSERVKQAERGWDDVALNISFRSTAPVLAAVDAVFANEAAADGVVAAGETLSHLSFREGQGGVVELWPTVAPDEDEEEKDWNPPVTTRNAVAPPARLAAVIAGRIRRWLDEEKILESANRPIQPGDIMVLVRRRAVFVEMLVRELKAREIEVAGVDRMVLRDQLAVQDLLALGQFLLLPGDDLTLAIVLKGPLFGLDDDDLFRLAHDRKESLWRSLRAQAGSDPRFAAAFDDLAQLLARVDFAPPFELFADILSRQHGRQRIIGRLRQDAADPVDEFLSRALAFEQNGVPSLQAFIQSILIDDGQVKRDLEQATRDEVRVMTVHGSKGLQAPIVFLPDTVSVPSQSPSLLWTSDDLLLWPPRSEHAVGSAADCRAAADAARDCEYRRLLYVAMTRAEERLYICGWETKRSPKEGSWHSLVSAAMEKDGHAVDIDLSDDSPLGWQGQGYRISRKRTVDPDRRPGAGTAEIPHITLPDWALLPPPPEKIPPTPLTPSRPDEDEPAALSPLTSGQAGGFRRGIIVHRLLQSLPELDPGDRAAAARRYLARPVHGLAEAEQAALADEVLAVLTDPSFADLFGPGSRAEAPIVGRVGDHIVSGQVDRLIVTGDFVSVIDYKTNRPPPETVDKVAPIYLRQMAAYRAVLSRIWPKRAVRCALLWTDGPTLMALPDALLDPWSPA